MSTADNTSIHRLLDEAFAAVELTADAQDLKEELRGNLAARATELQGSGMDAATAARTAVSELGDLSELVASLEPGGASAADLIARNHVRPHPLYVVRTVLLSLVFAAGLVIVTAASLHALAWTVQTVVVWAIIATALPLGLIVTDALRQETSQNYRLPIARALSYGAAAFAGMLGLALIAVWLDHLELLWLVIAGGLLAVASLVGFIWLGVTQTNRKKAWALALTREYAVEDRFSQDPASAARFGMYTVVIWTLAIVAFIVLSITVGFAWSWIALLLGFAVFMFTLARMLFPASRD